MVLILSSSHIDSISAHAEQVYPEECCGLMLGSIERDSQANSAGASANIKSLHQLLPVSNAWTPEQSFESSETAAELSKRRRFTITPDDMLNAQRQARAQSLSIIGVYHSHPDHPAVPSECDRAQAWPDYAYLIASVKSGKTVDIQTWALDSDHQFQTEVMRITSQEPFETPASV